MVHCVKCLHSHQKLVLGSKYHIHSILIGLSFWHGCLLSSLQSTWETAARCLISMCSYRRSFDWNYWQKASWRDYCAFIEPTWGYWESTEFPKDFLSIMWSSRFSSRASFSLQQVALKWLGCPQPICRKCFALWNLCCYVLEPSFTQSCSRSRAHLLFVHSAFCLTYESSDAGDLAINAANASFALLLLLEDHHD